MDIRKKDGSLAPAHIITGVAGEKVAEDYLNANGYTVICRNYKPYNEEIDIIAQKDQYIVFVEVKTRRETKSPYVRPAAAVNAKKRANLARAASCFIKNFPSDKFYRFDVIEVFVCSDKNTGEGSYKINHMKGVFGAKGRIWI